MALSGDSVDVLYDLHLLLFLTDDVDNGAVHPTDDADESIQRHKGGHQPAPGGEWSPKAP